MAKKYTPYQIARIVILRSMAKERLVEITWSAELEGIFNEMAEWSAPGTKKITYFGNNWTVNLVKRSSRK